MALSHITQATTSDPMMQTLRQLEIKIYDDPAAVHREAQTLLASLSYEQQPQLWLRCWLLALSENASQESIKEIDRYISLAESRDLKAEKTRLLLKKAEVYQTIWPNEKVKELYKEAQELAKRTDEPNLPARVLYEEAYYHYSLHEFPEGLTKIGEAVRLTESLNGPEEILRCEYRSVLAALLSATYETDKALAIYEECINWVKTQTFRSSAATYAYNAAMVLVLSHSKDEQRILRYFEMTAIQAKAIGETEREAVAIAGKARYLFEEQRFAEAKDLFQQSTSIFKTMNSTYNYHAGLIYLARSYAALNQLNEAEKYANEAKDALNTDFRSEHLWLLRAFFEIASKKKDIHKAYEYLKKYQVLYEKIKDDEEGRQLQKLKTDLGLQLEEERNAKLEAKNTLLAQELVFTNRLRIIALVLLALLSITIITMIIAVRRGRMVLRAKTRIQSILDTIDEGLITLDTQLVVTGELSTYAKQFLPAEDLTGKDIFSILLNRAAASSEQRSVWKESFQACMGEDAIAWDFNSVHLPTEIVLQETPPHILALHWQPLLQEGRVHRLLLSFRDVTSVKALEQEIAAERRERENLQTHIMEILSHNFQEARRLVLGMGTALPAWQETLQSSQDRSALKRRLHTDKGTARSLGLQGLSRLIHELEDALKDDHSPAEAATALQALAQEQRAYAKVFEDILRTPQNVESADTGNILDTTHRLLPDLIRRLQKSSIAFGGIEVADDIVRWESGLLQGVKDILLHALTNAVDHGFILPTQRGTALPEARFKVQARRTEVGISLQVKDNGAGLNLERLQKLAQERGFVPGPGQTLADVLLLDGVSTAETVSETSGRGVGLAAVRAICQELQGTLRIAANPDGPGTLLDITLKPA